MKPVLQAVIPIVADLAVKALDVVFPTAEPVGILDGIFGGILGGIFG